MDVLRTGSNVLLALVSDFSSASDDSPSHVSVPHHHVAVFVGGGVERRDNHKDESGYAVGMEYEYRFTQLWGIGSVIERIGGDQLRDTTIVVPVSLHPGGHWRLFAGPGFEFTSKKDKFLIRTGVGYEFPLGGHWSIAPEIMVDFIESGDRIFLDGVAFGYEF